MAFKKERMEKILEREISNIIFQDIKDERIKFVTITNVNITNDLSIATVFYTVFGNENQINASIEALNEAKGFIRTILSKKLEVKKTPDLRFKYDESYEQGNKIEAILNSLKK
ncbi:MAG: 30S ribosome-binding factor RbfA [Bacilli bacterium]|nr:30S ribosome-binding factor RbfA [Acholeplasmataceae bacterium]MDY2902020.1 30S ribosome-binding factor RbfA [Bacilli bacterium]